MAANHAQSEQLVKLSEVEFVQSQLHKHGVAPYLSSASQRVTHDIETVKKTLGCSDKEAVQYIIRGIALGPEPTAAEDAG